MALRRPSVSNLAEADECSERRVRSRSERRGACVGVPLDQNPQNLKTLTVLTVGARYWVADGLGMLAMATFRQAGLPLENARSRGGRSWSRTRLTCSAWQPSASATLS